MDSEEQPETPNQFSHPKVIQVNFENQGGDWVLVIDDGSEKPWPMPIEEDLVLQFMPVPMTSILRAKQTIGVGCLVLEKVFNEDEEDQANAKSKPE